MGEMADYMINGEDCQECGMPFMDGEVPGYPRTCAECRGNTDLDDAYESDFCPECDRFMDGTDVCIPCRAKAMRD